MEPPLGREPQRHPQSASNLSGSGVGFTLRQRPAATGFEHAQTRSDGIPVIKLHPRVRETSGYGIPTVNVNLYRMFMKHPQIIAPEETANAPRLIAGPDTASSYTQGNRVYAYGLTEPGRYLTYRRQ